MNLQTVQRLNQEGTRAIFGDATLATILEQAGVRDSGTLVLSVSGFTNAPEVIKMARAINPRIHILARAAYLADVPPCAGRAPTRCSREKARSPWA